MLRYSYVPPQTTAKLLSYSLAFKKRKKKGPSTNWETSEKCFFDNPINCVLMLRSKTQILSLSV